MAKRRTLRTALRHEKKNTQTNNNPKKPKAVAKTQIPLLRQTFWQETNEKLFGKQDDPLPVEQHEQRIKALAEKLNAKPKRLTQLFSNSEEKILRPTECARKIQNSLDQVSEELGIPPVEPKEGPA